MPQETKAALITNRLGIWLIALLPVAYFILLRHVDKDVLIFGSASWGFGVGIKLLLYYGLVMPLHKRLTHSQIALLNGFCSGLSEMSAALVLLVYLKTLTLDALLAFGLAAGSIEALVVASVPNLLSGTPLQDGVTKLETLIAQLPPRKRFWYEGILPIFERAMASIIHVASRGLVYVGWATGIYVIWLLALAPFVILDGVITYRTLLQSDFSSLAPLRRVYWGMLLCAGTFLLIFLLLTPMIVN